MTRDSQRSYHASLEVIGDTSCECGETQINREGQDPPLQLPDWVIVCVCNLKHLSLCSYVFFLDRKMRYTSVFSPVSLEKHRMIKSQVCYISITKIIYEWYLALEHIEHSSLDSACSWQPLCPQCTKATPRLRCVFLWML